MYATGAGTTAPDAATVNLRVMLNTNQNEKMYIEAYKDADYTPPALGRFSFLVNPEKYSQQYTIRYSDLVEPGRTGNEALFRSAQPQRFNFDILFDSSGVFNQNIFGVAFFNPFAQTQEITGQIDEFKNLVLKFSGDIHRPYYLKIIWGDFLRLCVLETLNIEYKLFRPDGKPIRAIAHCGFREAQSRTRDNQEQDRQSPDISHAETLKAGDTLTLLCNKIYQTPALYLEVAKANNLNQVRNIRQGTQLWFPPTQKSTQG